MASGTISSEEVLVLVYRELRCETITSTRRGPECVIVICQRQIIAVSIRLEKKPTSRCKGCSRAGILMISVYGNSSST